MSSSIAIVGLACRYADASTPRELWENIVSGRRAFRRIPVNRLSLSDYYTTDRNVPDGIYVQDAAVIRDYEFDRAKFHIAGDTYRVTDLAHWLALDVAEQALRDAGFPDGKGLPREKTGVLVGNTLTGEFTRANTLRLRWPYIRRTVARALRARQWNESDLATFLTELEDDYKSPFPVPNEESLAGGLSNTIAGRICNYFHLQGGGFTVDGACSSSLLAVTNACNALVVGDLDTALVGGVDLSLDPFELVGFARTGALASGDMRVFDREPSGFLPGEGCGFAVLMRLDDAIALGMRPYAVINGWGVSSDGGGGITRPEASGQRLALERAYQRAGYGIETVAYLEGHGTGTAVGDVVELQALSELLKQRGKKTATAIGSVKTLIGHTKAAAGIAGLIKSTMALHTQIIPPAVGVVHPRPEVDGGNSLLRTPDVAQAWPDSEALRTGVSSFGFGGINVHLTLEGFSQVRRKKLSSFDEILMRSPQDAELFLFSGETSADLEQKIQNIEQYAAQLSLAELVDLSIALAKSADSDQSYRAGVIASRPQELAEQLRVISSRLNDTDKLSVDVERGVFIGSNIDPGEVAFLFPGQAAPVRFNGGALGKRFDVVARCFENVSTSEMQDAVSTLIAQPAIIRAEIAGLKLLKSCGIEASVVLGHSLGELAALYWAGAMDEATLEHVTQCRAKLMSEASATPSGMLSLATDANKVKDLSEDYPKLVISCYNAPDQTIVSGDREQLLALSELANHHQIRTTMLPVSGAFHSAFMEEAAREFREFLDQCEFSSIRRPVLSTIKGGALETSEDVAALMESQLTEPVQFIQAFSALPSSITFCVEVGPGRVLTGLASKLKNVPTISLDVGGASITGLLRVIATSFVAGNSFNKDVVFNNRFTRPFNLDWRPKFFENPCESVPQANIERVPEVVRVAEKPKHKFVSIEGESTLDLVRRLIAKRVELPLAAIESTQNVLKDLHLNSMSVGEIVGEVARELKLPRLTAITDYATATVDDIACAFDELKLTGAVLDTHQKDAIVVGVDDWVRPFVVEYIPQDIQPGMKSKSLGAKWEVIDTGASPLHRELENSLRRTGKTGVVLLLSKQFDEDALIKVFEAARKSAVEKTTDYHFVLIQSGASVASIARTLFLENVKLSVTVIDVSLTPATISWIANEVLVANGYTEVKYDEAGQRSVPRLAQLEISPSDEKLTLTNADVLLVSGGGKGIAAECALAMAQKCGVRLALLGRSTPELDEELKGNLERMTQYGVEFEYLSTDVTRAEDVKAAVRHFETQLGPVTAVIHSAGINHPTLLKDLDSEALKKSLNIKFMGLQNLLAAIDADKLRLLVSFGSIIARTGMRGEAHYALANEWLTQCTEQFKKQHPQCHCLALEWSVWNSVGMGERLGRIELLEQQGIMPISVANGIDMLHQLIANRNVPTSIVVAGRLNDVPTLAVKKSTLPLLRFLDQPRIYYPQIELVTDVSLSTASDPYLLDHVYKGEVLLPAVLGMEAMTQVCSALSGYSALPALENLEFLQPVVIPRDVPVTIRIAALMRNSKAVDVSIRTSATDFSQDHFRGRFTYSDPGAEDSKANIKPMSGNVDLNPATDLYGSLFFHSGRFRRLMSFQNLSARECTGKIKVDEVTPWFSSFYPQSLLLGDPAARDTAIHAIQACIPHAQLLPTGVENIKVYNSTKSGPWTFSARERERAGEDFIYDLSIFNPDNSVREHWTGLKLRKVGNIAIDEWHEALLKPYLERRIEELVPGAHLKTVFAADRVASAGPRSHHSITQLLGEEETLIRRADGRPERKEGFVSAAHAGESTLAIAADIAVSCDLESVSRRSSAVVRNLLSPEDEMLVNVVIRAARETEELAQTRVWCVRECLKKAGLTHRAPVVLDRAHNDHWVVFRSANHHIATYPAPLRNGTDPLMVAVFLEGKK